MSRPAPQPPLQANTALPPALPLLPEVPESAAQGATAEIYRDIRAVLGVPLVNLIYRHLATVPGALEWAWHALRPHFVSGALAAQAQELRAVVAEAVHGWPLELGPGPAAAGVAPLVATYNRANSSNLMALTHLLGLADPTGALPQAAVRLPADGDAAADELPPLPAWHDLSTAQQERVLRLNRLGEPGQPQIVASLYRHLAWWPEQPARIEAALQALEARGALAAARAGTARAAAGIAGGSPLTITAAAPPSVDAALQHRLLGFATLTLPKMVPVGLALHAALRAEQPTTTPPLS